MLSKKLKKGIISSVLLLLLSICSLFSNQTTEFDNNSNVNNLIDDNIEHNPFEIRTSTDKYSAIGMAQNVTEYGRGYFQNNEINVTKGDNATIIVPNDWEAKEVVCNITNIYEYDKYWMNETFDVNDITSWTNSCSGNYANFSYGWKEDISGSQDSIYLQLNGTGADWDGQTAFLNYSFNLDREAIAYKNWEINFNYRFITNVTNNWLSDMDGGSKILCRISVGATTQDFNLGKPDQKVNGTWYLDNVAEFTPELYSFNPPGVVSILLGLAPSGNINLVNTGSLRLFFDNITFTIQTMPKPSQISLNISDITNGVEKSFIDVGFGEGTVTFDDSWLGDEGGKTHKFNFTSNSTGKLYINTDFYIKAISNAYTTTVLGQKGCEFSVENNTKTTWTMHVPISIPGSYQTDYYFNISKPTNWNVTHLYDPYGADKIADVSETSGIGNDTLIIPNSIITNGIWKIVAESPNYMLNSTIWKLQSTIWKENRSFEIGNSIKINGTVNKTLVPNLLQTNATLLIYYPNGTLWFQKEQKVKDADGHLEFDNFTLGANNASAGEYIANIRWVNNDNNISQAGLFILNFNVTHDALLKRANDQQSEVTLFSGDKILIKVNYTDLDTGTGILGATVNYTIDNETTINGFMTYYGGGVYIVEIDTTGWTKGLYNISISANKLHYKSQFQSKLIKFNVAETTSLSSPQIGGVNVGWGSNTTIDVNYNGSDEKGIENAIINCDWDQNYFFIKNVFEGHYQVELNTSNKVFGTHVIKINATRSGYETKEIFISVSIRNIYTNITYTQPDTVEYKANVTIQLKYGNIDDPQDPWITGADITISNESTSQYWVKSNYFIQENAGVYTVKFNSTILGGVGTYGIYITANKTNFANATSRINIFVEEISSKIDNIFMNGINKTIDKTIDLPIGVALVITIQFKDSLTGNHINNATVKLIGEGVSYNLKENQGLKQYSIVIDTRVLDIGVRFLTIFTNKTNYESSSALLRITVNRLTGKINTTDGISTININPGESLTLRIVLRDEYFNAIVPNAIVRYTYELGQGNLTETAEVGVYEVILTNIPEGTYKIIITVSAGDDYDFQRFEITLTVTRPSEDTLLLQVFLLVLVIGIVSILGYFYAYQKTLKYDKPVRKVRKLRNKLKKTRAPNIAVDDRESIIKELFEKELIIRAKFMKTKVAEDITSKSKAIKKEPITKEKITPKSTPAAKEKTAPKIEPNTKEKPTPKSTPAAKEKTAPKKEPITEIKKETKKTSIVKKAPKSKAIPVPKKLPVIRKLPQDKPDDKEKTDK